MLTIPVTLLGWSTEYEFDGRISVWQIMKLMSKRAGSALLLSLLGISPGFADDLLERAMKTSSSAEQIALATQVIQSAKEANDSFRSCQGHIVRAQGYLSTGQLEDALRDADAAVSEKPAESSPLLTRATIRSARRDCQGAVADADKAIVLADPADKVHALYSRGKINSACSHEELAIKDYRAAIATAKALKVSGFQPRLSLGVLLCGKGHFKEGLGLISEAERANPRSLAAQLNKAFCLEESGQARAARASYDKALSLADSPRGGHISMKDGPNEYLVVSINRASLAIGYYRRARIKSRAGNRDGALEDLSKAGSFVDEGQGKQMSPFERVEIASLYALRAQLLRDKGETQFAKEDDAVACRWDKKHCPKSEASVSK